MAIEWTPQQDSRIREGHAKSEALQTIADDLDLNKGHVSRRMKALGLTGNAQTKSLAAATQTTRDRLAAQREELATFAIADALNIRERIWEQYEVVVNTPAGPARETMDLPDAKAIAEFTTAIERLVKTHENLERIGSARSSDVAKAALTQMQQALEALAAEVDADDD